jgi:hypothetical protein
VYPNVGGVLSVSVERSARGPSVTSSESSHGGPELPWETILETCDGTLGRGELAGELVERGHAEVQPAAVDMIDAAIMRGELVSDGRAVVASSRQSNLNKSVNSAPAENPASESNGKSERPSIEEKVAEFAAEYPIRVTQPLAEFDGVSIRRDYAEIETESWTETQPDVPELETQPAAKGETVTDVSAVAWAAAMDAGNFRTVSRSEAAREAAKVDACRQRAESSEAEQSAVLNSCL